MVKDNHATRSPLKEKPLRQAGDSLQARIDDLREDYLLRLVLLRTMGLLIAAVGLFWLLRMPIGSIVVGLAIGWLIMLAYWFPKMRREYRQIRSLRLGRDGERIVAEHLEALKSQGTFVLHDVVGGDFNLDHVVVSPHGVFVIETKTRSKREGNPRVSFDGKTLLIDGMTPLGDPLTQARANAKWLRDLRKQATGEDYPVRPIIVFPGWWVENGPQTFRGDLWVLEPKAIPKLLPREPVRLSRDKVNMANLHLQRFIRTS